ncbi:hypothetical protein O181_050300 [Austropuccinia psidii MF-1]|uniref:Uncharacterized protein n=1 Tax=Austropuccinia psidii MF-1 TaxID=1389203 RepID=A0A9Q3DV30_9BASI|nr:hypothetical protein [Austropuccinia psidii MF-1]
MASSGNFDPSKLTTATRQLRLLILRVLNVWQRGRIAFNTTTRNLQSATIFSLERSHVAVPGCKLQTSGVTCGVRRMGLMGKSFQFLRSLLLMVLQGIPTVSNLNFLIELGADIPDLVTGSRQRDVRRWTNVGEPIPVGGSPTYSSSAVLISRINTEGVVKKIRQISDSQPDPDAEGSYELDASCQQIPEPYHSKHPQKFPTNSCCHSKFPSSHARPALNPATRPTPIQKPGNSPTLTSQQLQPVASSSRRRDGLSPLPFPAAQVFQSRDFWPIQATREYPNTASENQEAVARLFRRVVRNSREVIMYANDRTIPDTASEKIAAKFAWYEDELINDFQRTSDDFDRDH